MDLVDKEVQFRLGDLYHEKVQMNPDGVFHIKDGEGTHVRTGKHAVVGLKEDLNFFANLNLGDIDLPVYNDGDKAESTWGYVFSYARSVNDNKIGLLNDHWMYDKFVVPSELVKWILFKDYKFLLRWYEYLYTRTDPEFEQHKPTENKINNWLKEQSWGDRFDAETITIDDVVTHTLPDVKFSQKKPVLYWRGACSGGFNDFQRKHGYDKLAVERSSIVSYFENNPDEHIDLGFGNVKNCMGLRETIMHADYEHKYLIYLQGNDFGSNVCWIYGRNSVVFRPDFLKCHTAWDAHLEAWKNYVPFDHSNYHDLVDKIEWCEKNTDKCLNIIRNANKLHEMMYDLDHRKQVYTKMNDIIKTNLLK